MRIDAEGPGRLGMRARQVFKGHSLFSPAPRTDPGQRTRSFGPDWVRQNIGTALLKEYGRVVHQGDSQSAAFHAAGRYGLFDIRNETGRPFRSAGQLPSEGLKHPGRLRSIRIVEAPAVKVRWKSGWLGLSLHASLLSYNPPRGR